MTNQNLDSNNNGQADKADDSDALGGNAPGYYELDSHDHSDEAINPSSVSVTNAPADSDDVTRLQELDERALNQRTISFDGSGSEEFHKIGQISSTATSTHDGGVFAELQFGDHALSPAAIELVATARDGSLTAEHKMRGAGAGGRADFVITDDPNSEHFYLYVRTDNHGQPAVKVIHDANFWGGFDIQRNLTSSDLIGSIVYSTHTDSPTAVESLGELQAQKINGYWWLDPNASDWGAAVNSVVSEMAVGETLFIPPVQYDTSTTANITKNIRICAPVGAQKDVTNTKPEIVKQADIPILETGNDAQIEVVGLHGDSGVADTTPGFIFHGSVHVDSCSTNQLGSHGFYLHEESTGDNLTASRLTNVIGKGLGGDAVRFENSSGTKSDTSACHVDVRQSRGNSGYAVNFQAGFGNTAYVQTSDGSDGILNFSTARNYGIVNYDEGNHNLTPIYLRENFNTVEIRFSETAYGSQVDSSGSHKIIRWDNYSSVPTIESTYHRHSIAGGLKVADNGIALGENGAELSVNANGEIVAIDEAGNTTVIS